MTKIYRCECGREFEKAQSLNAHFSRCKIHRGEKYVARNLDPFRNLSKTQRAQIYEKRDSHNRGKTLTESHKENISIGLGKAVRHERWGGYREGCSGYSRKCRYQESWMDSSYELRFAKLLDKFEIGWKKNKNEKFLYEYEGKERKYYPDFFIESLNQWIEVKGRETPLDHAKWKYFPHSLKIIRSNDLKKLEKIENLEAFVAELVYAHG